jgi:hypothetical protein
MHRTDIAAICHEANRALCLAQGDASQPMWANAPAWQIESAIKGVDFNADNPAAPASASHDSWLAVKEADGWIYGREKNAELKQHPCMVPYADLPPAQQAKDHLFKAICAALLPFAQPPADNAHVAEGCEQF